MAFPQEELPLPDMSHWDRWYRTERRQEPSPFVKWAQPFIKTRSIVLEVGCGDGVDAIYCASMGHRVVATDPANVDWPWTTNPRFIRSAALEAAGMGTWDCIIARWLLHAIPGDDARLLLEEVTRRLNPGGVFACEFRVSLEGVIGGHYRRAVDPGEVRLLLHGMSIEHDSVNRGMSPMGDDDPMLGRIVARRPYA
jgi:SAM-dependent methyltransferase